MFCISLLLTLLTGTATPPAGIRCMSWFCKAMSKADSQPAHDEINHKSLVDFKEDVDEELEEEEEESLSRNDSPNGESSKLTFITMEVSGRKTFPDHGKKIGRN